jgi:hypothetical protein
MKTTILTALAVLLLCALTTHWHHKEQQRVCEYVYARIDIDSEPGVAPHHTEYDDAIVQASEHFNISIEKVNIILQKADIKP